MVRRPYSDSRVARAAGRSRIRIRLPRNRNPVFHAARGAWLAWQSHPVCSESRQGTVPLRSCHLRQCSPKWSPCAYRVPGLHVFPPVNRRAGPIGIEKTYRLRFLPRPFPRLLNRSSSCARTTSSRPCGPVEVIAASRRMSSRRGTIRYGQYSLSQCK